MYHQYWSYIIALIVFLVPVHSQNSRIDVPDITSDTTTNIRLSPFHFTGYNIGNTFPFSITPQWPYYLPGADNYTSRLNGDVLNAGMLNNSPITFFVHDNKSEVNNQEIIQLRSKYDEQLEVNKRLTRELINIKSELTHLKNSIESGVSADDSVNLFIKNRYDTVLWTILLLMVAIILGLVILDRSFKQSKIRIRKLTAERDKFLRNTHRLVEVNKNLHRQREDIIHQSNKLSSLNHVKDKLFAIIAHDIRRPLNNVEEILALINEQSLSLEEIQGISGPLHEHVSHTSILLNNLLNWAQLQIHGLNFSAKKVNLREIVSCNFRLLRFSADQKGITLYNHIDAHLLAWADTNMIDLIIRNLVSNAIKFSSKGDTVLVDAKTRKKYLEVSVKDSGTGISEELQKHLFKKSPPISTLGTMHEVGNGLGLILCKDFVEKNGGKIWVESDEGKGSTFIFTLPRFDKEDSRTSTSVYINN